MHSHFQNKNNSVYQIKDTCSVGVSEFEPYNLLEVTALQYFEEQLTNFNKIIQIDEKDNYCILRAVPGQEEVFLKLFGTKEYQERSIINKLLACKKVETNLPLANEEIKASDISTNTSKEIKLNLSVEQLYMRLLEKDVNTGLTDYSVRLSRPPILQAVYDNELGKVVLCFDNILGHLKESDDILDKLDEHTYLEVEQEDIIEVIETSVKLKRLDIAHYVLTKVKEVAPKLVNYVLNIKLDADQKLNYPLSNAILNNDVAMVNMLLVNGANSRDALEIAQNPENNVKEEILSILRAHKFDKKAECKMLMDASDNDGVRKIVLEKIQDKDINFFKSVYSKEGLSLLQFFVRLGDFNTVKSMLDAGAFEDIYSRKQASMSAPVLAANHKKNYMIKLFRSRRDSQSKLEKACTEVITDPTYGTAKNLDCLLRNGAKLPGTIQDKDGNNIPVLSYVAAYCTNGMLGIVIGHLENMHNKPTEKQYYEALKYVLSHKTHHITKYNIKCNIGLLRQKWQPSADKIKEQLGSLFMYVSYLNGNNSTIDDDIKQLIVEKDNNSSLVNAIEYFLTSDRYSPRQWNLLNNLLLKEKNLSDENITRIYDVCINRAGSKEKLVSLCAEQGLLNIFSKFKQQFRSTGYTNSRLVIKGIELLGDLQYKFDYLVPDKYKEAITLGVKHLSAGNVMVPVLNARTEVGEKLLQGMVNASVRGTVMATTEPILGYIAKIVDHTSVQYSTIQSDSSDETKQPDDSHIELSRVSVSQSMISFVKAIDSLYKQKQNLEQQVRDQITRRQKNEEIILGLGYD